MRAGRAKLSALKLLFYVRVVASLVRVLLVITWIALYYMVYFRLRLKVKSRIYTCRLKEELDGLVPGEVADTLSRMYSEELNATIKDMFSMVSIRKLLSLARREWKGG